MSHPPVDWHKRFEEQARWTRNIREYLYRRSGVTVARRLLDLGCGTGVLAKELSGSTQAQIHCLDINREFLNIAAGGNPEAFPAIGDAHALPYQTEVFDIALCHFLLLWVFDPKQVLSEMARVVRSGGFVMALAEPDYGGRIDYPVELEQLGRLQMESLQQQGADPRIGRRLAGLFSRAGLIEIETGILGGQWSREAAAAGFDSEWEIIRSDLSFLETKPGERNILPLEAKMEILKEIAAAASALGERVLFVPTFYASGIKP